MLSGKRSISAETEQRVRASIRELGYRPNAGARALASSRTNVLALVMPLRSDMHVPVLMQFVTGVVTAARAHEHDVLLLTQDEGVEGLRRVAGTAMTDALIVMDIEEDDPRLEVLRRLPQPSALIGVPADPSGLACVDLDFETAGAVCVDHLAGLGHRRIGFIGAPAQVYERGTSFAWHTLAGFRGAAERHGAAAASVACTPDHTGVRRALAELRAAGPEPSGLVVHNEDALPALLDILGSDGVRIPDDLSVVAICSDQQAESLPVPITAVAIPAEEIASSAVRAVMRGLGGEPRPGVHLLRPRLRVRASSALPAAPPPARGAPTS
ncbi:LacI family DNA-binding transcriptional regulator [Spinactinospora alkalitolerans]